MIWHEHNSDGTKRDAHCPGCYNVVEIGMTLYAVCNECGERTLVKDQKHPDMALVREAIA